MRTRLRLLRADGPGLEELSLAAYAIGLGYLFSLDGKSTEEGPS